MGSSAELMEGSLAGGDVDVNLEDGPDQNGEEGEDHVVEGYWPGEPERLTWAHRVEGEHRLDYCEDHVFVEKVEDHFCYSHVVESTVMEQQFP